MKLTWYGNATIKISSGSTSLVTDPYFSRNPELPKMVEEDLADADFFLACHGHFDHVFDIPGLLAKRPVTVYGPKEVVNNLIDEFKVEESLLEILSSGDKVAEGELNIEVFDAEHVRFDRALVLSTLAGFFTRRFPGKWRLFARHMRENRRCPVGRCLTYLIQADNQRILHLSSLAISVQETYPEGVELLTLPMQGHSRLDLKGMEIVERIKPKAVYLHHTDDAFPPISRKTDTGPFKQAIQAKYPEIRVIEPEYRVAVTL